MPTDKPISAAAIRDELAARSGTWKDIAERAEVSHSWISKFVNGRIPNPGYATLTRLHDVLVSDPRELGPRTPA